MDAKHAILYHKLPCYECQQVCTTFCLKGPSKLCEVFSAFSVVLLSAVTRVCCPSFDMILLNLAQDVRSANVKALTDSTLLALSREDFNKLLGSLQNIRNIWRFEALRKVRLPRLLSSLLHCPNTPSSDWSRPAIVTPGMCRLHRQTNDPQSGPDIQSLSQIEQF
jgi:hypothetical protein